MLQEKDPELREMAQEELAQLEPELGVLLLEHAARLGERAVEFLPLAELADELGQLALFLGDFAIAVAIGDDGRVGHLLCKLFEALFELLELLTGLHGRLGDDQLAALL